MSSSNATDRALTKLDQLEVSDQCIAIKNGGTMKTYLARHKKWGPVVYKKLEESPSSDEYRIKLIREAEVQIRLRHPSIARLFGIVLEEGQCGLVLEYVKYGNIMQFMQDYTVDWGWKLQMSFDIVLGMNYLHTQTPSIADGELTNQNVLIGRGFKAKISNFGFSHWKQYSKSLSKTSAEREFVSHVPPENWKSADAEKGEKYDVYGFGILLYKVLTGRAAYDGETDSKKVSNFVISKGRPKLENIPKEIPIKFKKIVIDCWAEEITKRPPFSDLKIRFEKLCSQNEEFIVKARKSLNAQEEKKELEILKKQEAANKHPSDEIANKSDDDSDDEVEFENKDTAVMSPTKDFPEKSDPVPESYEKDEVHFEGKGEETDFKKRSETLCPEINRELPGIAIEPSSSSLEVQDETKVMDSTANSGTVTEQKTRDLTINDIPGGIKFDCAELRTELCDEEEPVPGGSGTRGILVEEIMKMDEPEREDCCATELLIHDDLFLKCCDEAIHPIRVSDSYLRDNMKEMCRSEIDFAIDTCCDSSDLVLGGSGTREILVEEIIKMDEPERKDCVAESLIHDDLVLECCDEAVHPIRVSDSYLRDKMDVMCCSEMADVCDDFAIDRCCYSSDPVNHFVETVFDLSQIDTCSTETRLSTIETCEVDVIERPSSKEDMRISGPSKEDADVKLRRTQYRQSEDHVAHHDATRDTRAHLRRALSNEEVKDNLVRNYVTVLNNADIDVDEIADHLYQANVIKDDKYRKVRKEVEKTGNREALRMLIEDLMCKKHPRGFLQLLETFEKIKPYLAKTIRESTGSSSFDMPDGDINKINRKIKHRVVDNYRYLVENLDLEDGEQLFDLLFQEKIISLEERKSIQKKNDSGSTQIGTKALLEFLLLSDDEKAFVVFKGALKETYPYIVEGKLEIEKN